ncbi:MAG: FTR1 family protein [Candidatus Eremiobacteraeota bacterium]|nr:FTR1 family protein [Candidatus Eremiobacteraeota bacterium]
MAAIAGALIVLSVVLWQAVAVAGAPDPLAAHTSAGAAALDIGVLVFREGLECVLVLAALTASMVGATRTYRRPIAAGVVVGAVATLVTWRVAVTVIDRLTESFPALQVQAATGLLAIVVLLIVMNWFFHKVYWTGWIGLHTKRKRELLRPNTRADKRGDGGRRSRAAVLWGLGLLGFSSLYREGFEVVLFLQTYRLRLGGAPVLRGVLVGLTLTAVVAVLTFVAQRRLPYKKMLILTGGLLGAVLLVMVGEQAQEMQLAHWLPTTPIPALAERIPAWLGLWFSVFPTVETLGAQLLAAVLVLGSYTMVQVRLRRRERM